VIVFACDTALEACAVAIVRDGETLAHISEPMTRGQAERLPLMVREAMRAAGTAFADLDLVAVTTGPGSFTGVRVGLSFARALALALSRPIVGISTLEALALEEGQSGLRAALIETPAASYFALYENGAALIAPRAIERGEHEILIAGRAPRFKGPGRSPDVVALARRALALDPAGYPPDPLYLRHSGATLPGGA
jgi:tRNA threonylcarbamoyladenosine biosynthesis protein TsaB